MRENRILRLISYITLPILILTLIISLFYLTQKEEYIEYNKYDSSFFQTEEFLNQYMTRLSRQAYNLIFNNESYNSIKDGDFKICYNNDINEQYYRQIKDYYYIILYKNIALTNVELTAETNTVEKIKNYISNQNSKKTNIINGNVESESEIISNKAIKYYDDFEETYYSINNDIQKYESEKIEQDIIVNNINSNSNIKEFYTTKIEDFQIYTSYVEEVVETNDDIFLRNSIINLNNYENEFLYAVPICSILIIVISIYLIISIGHTKGKEGIDLNNFDKIPIEIIFLVGIILLSIIIAVIFEFMSYFSEKYFNFLVSFFITGYFISYILCAIMTITTIKRIKAKVLIKESITGKIYKWCLNTITNILNKLRKFIKETTNSWNITSKLICGIILYFICVIILIIVLNGFGFVIALIGSAYIFYKFVERINCYKKIEIHLKQIYEGDTSTILNRSEFTPEFQEIVKYINDISSGFKNAIEEGIKSEKLKTELITNVSHDIKTPLTSIINYVDLLKKENIENEKIKEYIEILDNKSQRLKKLTEDLVEASKASSGNVKLNIERINICELIKQTTGEFEDKFKDKKLEIISNIPDKEIFINADNRYMYRIIENIFSNISKYALESSRVYIDINKNNKKVKIEVKNISKERLNITPDELMQRFVRGDKSRTTEGSGLGISISKSLTELQKGKFDLKVDGDLFKVELEFDTI